MSKREKGKLKGGCFPCNLPEASEELQTTDQGVSKAPSPYNCGFNFIPVSRLQCCPRATREIEGLGNLGRRIQLSLF